MKAGCYFTGSNNNSWCFYCPLHGNTPECIKDGGKQATSLNE